MNIRLLFCSVLMAASAAVGAQAAESEWVLLEGDQAAILIHQCSRESPEAIQSVWKPSPAVLQKMEARLAEISKLESKLCCGNGARVDDVHAYYRQYAGLVIEDRKLIYINAFARTAASADWRQQPMMPCDGGLSFWGVLYDPASGEFFDLAFNGEA